MPESKKFKIFFLSFLALFFLLPSFVLALEINYPNLPGATPPQDFLASTSPEQILPLYVKYIFNLIIWVSGLIALGVLIYAGIRYLLSAGRPEVIISAKNQLSSAFLGIIILLSSVLVLQLLNPQLIALSIPEPEPVEEIETPSSSPPPTQLYVSSINTEIPFAKIIEEGIFETKVVQGTSTKPRMTRIKENAANSLAIAQKLESQNEDLKNKTDLCSCDQAQPRCDPCVSGQSCSCDTCLIVRGAIENIEKNNLDQINELKKEQEKTATEIRLLREELDKLDRAKKLMLGCKLASLNSLAGLLGTKKFYLANNWLVLDIKYWEDILTVEDWANFYGPVSGTIWGGELPPAESTTTATTTYEVPPQEGQTMSCPTEMPVGEIIDRAKRIGSKLVEGLESLSGTGKELIAAVDKMQVLVSECTSQIPRCYSVCIPTNFGCIKHCAGITCPFAEIADQLEKIKEIKARIEEIVKGEIKVKENKGGIIPIIDEVVPKLLEDVDKLIRKPMKQCISEISPEALGGQPQIILSDCETALRTIGPKGKVIQNCCLDEPEFQTCLNNCYLEAGEKNYKDCLENCQREQSQNLKSAGKTRESEIIATCLHKINYYCCGK